MVNSMWRRFSVIIVLSITVLVMVGCGSEEKVGVIDFQRILKEAPQVEEGNKEIQAKHEEIVARLVNAQSELSEEEFKAKETQSKQELSIFAMGKQKQFESLMQNYLAIVAKDKKLGIIVHKEAIHYNGIDVTDDILKRLKDSATTEKDETKKNEEGNKG